VVLLVLLVLALVLLLWGSQVPSMMARV